MAIEFTSYTAAFWIGLGTGVVLAYVMLFVVLVLAATRRKK